MQIAPFLFGSSFARLGWARALNFGSLYPDSRRPMLSSIVLGFVRPWGVVASSACPGGPPGTLVRPPAVAISWGRRTTVSQEEALVPPEEWKKEGGGVKPIWTNSVSAPNSSSSRTTSRWPLRDASIRGVTPSFLAKSWSAPDSGSRPQSYSSPVRSSRKQDFVIRPGAGEQYRPGESEERASTNQSPLQYCSLQLGS